MLPEELRALQASGTGGSFQSVRVRVIACVSEIHQVDKDASIPDAPASPAMSTRAYGYLAAKFLRKLDSCSDVFHGSRTDDCCREPVRDLGIEHATSGLLVLVRRRCVAPEDGKTIEVCLRCLHHFQFLASRGDR